MREFLTPMRRLFRAVADRMLFVAYDIDWFIDEFRQAVHNITHFAAAEPVLGVGNFPSLEDRFARSRNFAENKKWNELVKAHSSLGIDQNTVWEKAKFAYVRLIIKELGYSDQSIQKFKETVEHLKGMETAVPESQGVLGQFAVEYFELIDGLLPNVDDGKSSLPVVRQIACELAKHLDPKSFIAKRNASLWVRLTKRAFNAAESDEEKQAVFKEIREAIEAVPFDGNFRRRAIALFNELSPEGRKPDPFSHPIAGTKKPPKPSQDSLES
jgi:hypothetical protein